eukprot:scaffold40892_cov50-Phaeocystis_antarctica.AAC.2
MTSLGWGLTSWAGGTGPGGRMTSIGRGARPGGRRDTQLPRIDRRRGRVARYCDLKRFGRSKTIKRKLIKHAFVLGKEFSSRGRSANAFNVQIGPPLAPRASWARKAWSSSR